MVSMKSLDKKEKELLLHMDNQELQDYIKNIVKEYYNCIVYENTIQLNQCILQLNKLKEIYEDKNIDGYITYCLITGFNEVLINSNNSNLALIDVKEPGLDAADKTLLYRTKFDNILDAIFFKKVNDKEQEISDSINDNEDILKFFNYSSYPINED